MERPPNEQTPDGGRSREREQQDAMLEREARRESWVTRLRRHRWFAKGRAYPGNPGGSGREGKTERSRR
jgi:hypothetical protein